MGRAVATASLLASFTKLLSVVHLRLNFDIRRLSVNPIPPLDRECHFVCIGQPSKVFFKVLGDKDVKLSSTRSVATF